MTAKALWWAFLCSPGVFLKIFHYFGKEVSAALETLLCFWFSIIKQNITSFKTTTKIRNHPWIAWEGPVLIIFFFFNDSVTQAAMSYHTHLAIYIYIKIVFHRREDLHIILQERVEAVVVYLSCSFCPPCLCRFNYYLLSLMWGCKITSGMSMRRGRVEIPLTASLPANSGQVIGNRQMADGREKADGPCLPDVLTGNSGSNILHTYNILWRYECVLHFLLNMAKQNLPQDLLWIRLSLYFVSVLRGLIYTNNYILKFLVF